MYKAKKSANSKQTSDEAEQCAKDIKDAIKKMYLDNKNNEKLIESYEKAFQSIKNEYTILYQKYEALEKKIAENENENKKRNKRNQHEDEYEDYNNIQYIVKKKKKPKIIYVDDEDDDINYTENFIKEKYSNNNQNDEKNEREYISDNMKMNKTNIKNKNEIDQMQKIRRNNKKGISKAIKF